MVNLHFLLKFSKNINIQQTSTSRNYRWSAYIFYHWKYVYGKIFPDKEHYPSQPNVFIAYLPSRAGNDICHIALSMSSSHYILTGKKKHLSLDVAIIINVDNIIFSKWTSLRKPSSISGIQSLRSTDWRRSRGRRCSRRCLGSGSWRTRRSTTSSSETLTFIGKAVDINAIIFSVSTSQYRVRWTLMTIPWTLMRVSSKLEAVSIQNSWKSIISQYVSNVSDYDTEEVVMCKAHFIYDVHRQRSLQHLIQIEELPSHFKTVRLPSGQKRKNHFDVKCVLRFSSENLVTLIHKRKLSEGRELLENSWHQLNYPQKCPPITRTNGTKDKRHFTTKNEIIFAQMWHGQNCYLSRKKRLQSHSFVTFY